MLFLKTHPYNPYKYKENYFLSREKPITLLSIKQNTGNFPGGAVVKNPPANAGDTGSSPDPGRSHMLQSN